MAKFQISYPVRPHSINQGFGIANTAPSALPTYKSLGMLGHNGHDLKAYHGQPVMAAHDGIAYWEVDDNQGEGVVLRTIQQFDYKVGQAYFKSIYWHMADSTKEPQFASPVYLANKKNGGQGVTVKKGDIIGYADNTGLSTGDHLHFGVKPINPGTSEAIDATDVGIGAFVNLEQNNGYFGAIDPIPYFDGTFADDKPIPTADLSPADNVAVLAAESQASGDTKTASILWSLVAFIKAFFQ